MVGRSGLEPPASRLSGACSNQLSYRPMVVRIPCKILFTTRCLRIRAPTGGDERVRTAGLLRAKQALSQLSYTPIWSDAHGLRHSSSTFGPRPVRLLRDSHIQRPYGSGCAPSRPSTLAIPESDTGFKKKNSFNALITRYSFEYRCSAVFLCLQPMAALASALARIRVRSVSFPLQKP